MGMGNNNEQIVSSLNSASFPTPHSHFKLIKDDLPLATSDKNK